MPVTLKNKAKVIKALNGALGWELRASALYAHYAVYLRGLESLQLVDHFKAESMESFGHAEVVRGIIADLGGEAITTRDSTEIVHTEDWKTMLEEGLKTEKKAAAAYKKLLPMVKEYYPFWHSLSHILKDEMDAVIEIETLLGR
jgi:bacterioferritin (cytochrome b1)